MPSFYRTLTPELAEFIERQKIFFTATAPSDNGRITFMWCSFETRPLILRLYCYGKLVERHTPHYLRWRLNSSRLSIPQGTPYRRRPDRVDSDQLWIRRTIF